MSFYESARLLVDSMLSPDKFGVAVTLRKPGAVGAYDAASQTVVGATAEQDFIVNAVLIPDDDSFIDGKHFEWNNEFHGGTNVEQTDATFWLSAKQTNGASLPKPELGFKIISSSGEEFFVTGCREIHPGPITVAYMVHTRK